MMSIFIILKTRVQMMMMMMMMMMIVRWDSYQNHPFFSFGVFRFPRSFNMSESELRYTLLGDCVITLATSRAASMRRSWIKAGFSLTALPINSADLA